MLHYVFLCLCLCFLETPVAAAGALVTCYSSQVTSLKDSMTSAWLIASHQPVHGYMRCSALCLDEARCVSFLHNDVTHDCHLFAIVKGSSDITSVAVGYRYFQTCRAAGYYGAACTVNADCKLNNTRCFQARCRCKEGYSFDANQKQCIAKCTTYGTEFETIPEYFINANNAEALVNVNTTSCRTLCLKATTYVCRTFEVKLAPDLACSLAFVTKLDVPAADWLHQSVPVGGWVTVHYQRHCSL